MAKPKPTKYLLTRKNRDHQGGRRGGLKLTVRTILNFDVVPTSKNYNSKLKPKVVSNLYFIYALKKFFVDTIFNKLEVFLTFKKQFKIF